ncbi:MAG TPA: hypothetical protein VFH26_06055 [Gemmatimonadales bacterium]|nr:hypothetical protein [Gemmatimonadales bacterium]
MRWPTITAGLGIPLVVWTGCRAAANGATPEECAPVTSELPAKSSTEITAGEYQLRLVATSGAKVGSTVDGSLRLQPQEGELRYRPHPGADSSVIHPLYGAAELDLAAVDAVEVGSISSTDPTSPGVLVIERHERAGQTPRAEIILRLGSEANRRDRQRIDGGYTALRVREVSPSRFAGTWASGILRERASGYFCAVRKDG